MAETMFDYIKEFGDRSFEKEPVNEVDSLILCQLSYLKFDGMVPGVSEEEDGVSFQEIYRNENYARLFKNTWFEKNNQRLFEDMMNSKRFGDMKMNYFVNIIETDTETQFCAITFTLGNGTDYVVYRGTDETIVGWKEDLNMAFLDPVPGQAHAVQYIEKVGKNLSDLFYVGGHSKGGNLAVYTAMNCEKHIQDRMIKIYNMDGPSFRPEVLKKYDYASIQSRTYKIIPQSSLVGMFFEKTMEYRVVKSKALGFLQHDPFSWQVKYGRFVDVSQVYEGQKFMDDTLNEWILSLNEEQIRTFSDTVYQILSASEKDNLIDFSIDWIDSMNGMMNAIKEVDEETKTSIKETIKALLRLTQVRMRNELSKRPKQIMDNIIQKIESIEVAEGR